MSTDYQEQIDKLNAKVQQLLEEKRKIKASRDDLQKQLESVTTERDQAKAELHRITVEQPRAEILNEAAPEGMGETLGRELAQYFDIVRQDDGTDIIANKDGSPVEIGGNPVPFTVEGIRQLNQAGLAKLGCLLKGSGATGGGAAGVHVTTLPPGQANKGESPKTHFGIR